MNFRKNVGYNLQESVNQGFDSDTNRQQEEQEIQALEQQLNKIEKYYSELQKNYCEKINSLYQKLKTKDKEYNQLKDEVKFIKQQSVIQNEKILTMNQKNLPKLQETKNPVMRSFKQIKNSPQKIVQVKSDRNIKKSSPMNLKGPTLRKSPTNSFKPNSSDSMNSYMKSSSPSDKVYKKTVSPNLHQNTSSPSLKHKKKQERNLKMSEPSLPVKNKRGLDFLKQKIK